MLTSRIQFTAKQKDELWERWKSGQSVLAISRALDGGTERRPADRRLSMGDRAERPRCRAVAA